MTKTKTVAITGNTFPVKDQIKALGGKWDADSKAWMVPADKADQAKALVSGAPTPKREEPRSRREAPKPVQRQLQTGEREIMRPSRDKHDGYEVGETLHLLRVTGGSGPDGRYWTVVNAGKRRVGEAYDDTWEDRHGTAWAAWAHVRPATEAEFGPVVARIEKASQRKMAVEELQAAIAAMPSQGRGAKMPEWATRDKVKHERRISAYSSESEQLYVTEVGAANYCPIYDDDPVIRVALAGTDEYNRVVAALAMVQ